MSERPHVLIVDASPLFRESGAARLQRDGRFRVTTAPDVFVARSKMRLARPDLVVLGLDHALDAALAFLQERATDAPLPVLVRGSDPEAIVRALALGAADVLPERLVSGPPTAAGDRELVARIAAASGARVARGGRQVRRVNQRDPARVATTSELLPLVGIGASTGGTSAVQQVLGELPRDAPPVVVVIHMPPEFTGAFARHLDKHCRMSVREARHGERLERGLVLVSPGDRHMEVERRGAQLHASLRGGAPVSGHRPSVDVLLHSVARSCGAGATGVVLTGMGRDGAEGLLALHEAGGTTVVQDEASSVVFGMAREAIRLGAADRVLPLARIGAELLHPR